VQGIPDKDIGAFLADEKNFLYVLDLARGEYVFTSTTRGEIAELPFLDNRTLGKHDDLTHVHASRVLPALAPDGQALAANTCHFIFHTSFCCSTMIARCLDWPGKNLSLKEPFAFLSLSGFCRNAPGFDPANPNWKVMRDSTLYLLSRPFEGKESVLIKPSNGANNMLPEALAYPATGNVLLLYRGLEAFLVSIIRGGPSRANNIEQMAALARKDFPHATSLTESDVAGLTHVERAAFFWAVQMKVFEGYAKTGAGKVKTLDADAFLSDPEALLGRLSIFFCLGFTKDEIAKILQSPAFLSHSKNPRQAFSAGEALEQTVHIRKTFQQEFQDARAICEKMGVDVSKGLSNAV